MKSKRSAESYKRGGLEIATNADDNWRAAWKEYLRVLLAEHREWSDHRIALWAVGHHKLHEVRILKPRTIQKYLKEIRNEPAFSTLQRFPL